MTNRFVKLAFVVCVFSSVGSAAELTFPASEFISQDFLIGGVKIRYRSWRNVTYVSKPVVTNSPENDGLTFHQMNVFAPQDGAERAPILLISSSGGYLPGSPADLDGRMGDVIRAALSKGYVVVGPGQRGHNNKDPKTSKNNGKAPAGIVDFKAAVRYLRRNDDAMPGDAESIVSTGSSAGGAFSCLLGAAGNHPDYEPYLDAIGAADERDDIYAAACYCPITNLENADSAYEWQFGESSQYERWRGRTPSWSKQDQNVARDLRALFPAYLNGLGLVATRSRGSVKKGGKLALNSDGTGSFRDYVSAFVTDAAQQALGAGRDLASTGYLRIEGDKVLGIDFVRYSDTRMKRPPAFDALALGTFETSLFGSQDVHERHFTGYASKHGGEAAEETVVKMMNPMNYIGQPGAKSAQFWRIRHGTEDRHTSLAISIMLATALESSGKNVDFTLPWGVRHGGHYDLDELFEWIDSVARR